MTSTLHSRLRFTAVRGGNAAFKLSLATCLMYGGGVFTQAASAQDTGAAPLEEVIVSAQKRDESLKDVPVPVAVLDADVLAANGQVLLRDYAASVPGFSVQPGARGNQGMSIRGLSGATTVGVVIDDVPYGGSTSRVGGGRAPDIDPGDLERIEVLRGPQGTLYGANSLGGLLKFVTKNPSPDRYSGRLEAGFNSVAHGDDPGYDLRLSANIPLSDTSALRVSGFTRQDPGYIDNPILDLEDVNELQSDGARLSASWQPSESFSLRLSALYQHYEADQLSVAYVLPGLDELQQNDVAGVGRNERTIQAYGAVLKLMLGSVELTSATGYSNFRHDELVDYTPTLGARTVTQFGVSGAAIQSHFTNDKFTQELRLAIPLAADIEWTAGVFYTYEDGPFHQKMFAVEPTGGEIVGQWWDGDYPVTFEEYAAFSNVSFQLTERFDVQLGGRYSDVKERQGTATQIGPYTSVVLGQPSPFVTPAVAGAGNAFTYLLTPRFKFSPDVMAYVRLASGYRPGGANNALGAPPAYEPDRTQSYEVGVKADLFERKLVVDASLYYIDWQDIQISLTTPNRFFYTGNAGAAKSEGVELAVEARPLPDLTIAGWVAYDHAVLTEAFPVNSPNYGVAGNRLQDTPRFSAYLSVEQEFPLADNPAGFVGGAVSRVGDRLGPFTATPQRTVYPAYTKTDLRAGVKSGSWTLNLYVNNLSDERGMLSQSGYAFAFSYIVPRTIGASLVKTF